ncbi:hypothetical protein [Holophaga foetida]|uniref:hypothetical protein n=1 Tax=Holophaga foetida TaxID=35839 RepID=UPI0002471C2A|nr:hypothetical protein [Holophaga foetida]
MTPFEVLKQSPEPLPPWLRGFDHGDAFWSEAFFGSRVVYYPGSGTDGQPVELFGSTHSAHCFVYVDYRLEQAAIEWELTHATHGFRGYHTFARVQLAEQDLSSGGWHPHIEAEDRTRYGRADVAPFGFLEILEQDPDRNDSHGRDLCESRTRMGTREECIDACASFFSEPSQNRPPQRGATEGPTLLDTA